MNSFKGIESDRIRLRAIEPEDLELLYRIENDPEHWDAGHNKMPYSRYYLKSYLGSLTGDIFLDRKIRLVIERTDDDEAVGIIDLYDISPMYLKAETGIIVFKEFREQGYAKEATNLLVEYAFRYLLLHQVYATTSANNIQSLALYRSCGFEETARLKDWTLTEDGYQDEVLFQRVSEF